MENLIKAIKLLKTSYSIEKEYTSGGCWNFAEALRLLHNHEKGLVVYDQINGHAYYTFLILMVYTNLIKLNQVSLCMVKI